MFEAMKADVPPIKYGFIYWRIAVWKLCWGSMKQAALAYIGATAAIRFVDMNGEQKIIVGITTIMAVGGFVDGFLDTTIGRLVAGKPPIKLPSNGGDSTTFVKKP